MFLAIVVAIAIVSSFIPYAYWDHPLWPNRYVVEGEVAAIEGDEIGVVFYTAREEGEGPSNLGASMVLKGKVPDYCRVGESVRIAISKGSSLYEEIGQGVQVHFYRDGSLLTGAILPAISPIQVGAPSMTLVDLNDNGTVIVYFVTEDD